MTPKEYKRPRWTRHHINWLRVLHLLRRNAWNKIRDPEAKRKRRNQKAGRKASR